MLGLSKPNRSEEIRELTERFCDASEKLERSFLLKMNRDSEIDFERLVDVLQEVLDFNLADAGWISFAFYAKVHVLACLAAFMHMKLSQPASLAYGSDSRSERRLALADLCYAAVLHWSSYPPYNDPAYPSLPTCLFHILEAHHMLSQLGGQRKVDLLDALMNPTKKMTDAIAEFLPTFCQKKNRLSVLLMAFPPTAAFNKPLSLSVDRTFYDYAVERIIFGMSLSRMIWLWMFAWDEDKERLTRNDELSSFSMLPFAPSGLDSMKAEHVSRLDIKVFIHLSAHVAFCTNGKERLPYCLSRSRYAASKKQDAWWSSVVALAEGQMSRINAQCLEEGLKCLRLLEHPTMPPSHVHSVAKMLHHTLDEATENKDAIADYAEVYWTTLEKLLTGQLKSNNKHELFHFPIQQDDGSTGLQNPEDRLVVIDQCKLQHAKILLQKGLTEEALKRLENCKATLAMKLRAQLYETMASMIEDTDNTERRLQKSALQERALRCREQLLAESDGFDETILSNKEVKLIEDVVSKSDSYKTATSHNRLSSSKADSHDSHKCCSCRTANFCEGLLEQNKSLIKCVELLVSSVNSLSLELRSQRAAYEGERAAQATLNVPGYSTFGDMYQQQAATMAAAACFAPSVLQSAYNGPPVLPSLDPYAQLQGLPTAVKTDFGDARMVQPPLSDAVTKAASQPLFPGVPSGPSVSFGSSSGDQKTTFSFESVPQLESKSELFNSSYKSLTPGSAAKTADTAESASGLSQLSWPPTSLTPKSREAKSTESPGQCTVPFGSLGIAGSGSLREETTSTPAPSKEVETEHEEPEPADVPDFAPVVPLPDLIEVKTGEEEEELLFKQRAKLFGYHGDTKEYKERGRGDLKVLKHLETGRVRLVMRRDAVHKLCANQFITADMHLMPLAKSDRACSWKCQDFSDGELKAHVFAVSFRTKEQYEEFRDVVLKCVAELKSAEPKEDSGTAEESSQFQFSVKTPEKSAEPGKPLTTVPSAAEKPLFGSLLKTEAKEEVAKPVLSFTLPDAVGGQGKLPLFGAFSVKKEEEGTPKFGDSLAASSGGATSSQNLFADALKALSKTDQPPVGGGAETKPAPLVISFGQTVPLFGSVKSDSSSKQSTEQSADADDDTVDSNLLSEECDQAYKPIVPLPEKVNVVTGEEDEEELFCGLCRLYRYHPETKEYKERGTGNLRILKHADTGKVRLVMRRSVIWNVVANHPITTGMKLTPLKGKSNVYCWTCYNYLDGEVSIETLSVRFKEAAAAEQFYEVFTKVVAEAEHSSSAVKKTELEKSKKDDDDKEFLKKFLPPAGSWTCQDCYAQNKAESLTCPCCSSSRKVENASPSAGSNKSSPFESVSVEGLSIENNSEHREDKDSKLKNEEFYSSVDLLSEEAGWDEILFKDIVKFFVAVDEDTANLKTKFAVLQIQRHADSDFCRLVANSADQSERMHCCHFLKPPVKLKWESECCYSWDALDYVGGEPKMKHFKILLEDEKHAKFMEEAWKKSGLHIGK